MKCVAPRYARPVSKLFVKKVLSPFLPHTLTFCTRSTPNCCEALPPSIRAIVDSAIFAAVSFSIASHALVVSWCG